MTLNVHVLNANAGGHEPRVVSPELVLVDPELASAARASLPDPGETVLARVAEAHAARMASAPWIPDELTGPDREGTSRRVLFGVAAVTMLALLLFDVRVEVGERPASAGPEALTVAPEDPMARGQVTKAPSGTSGSSSRSKRAPTDRRFAWAPSAGASRYHVEFFRGAVRVYAEETVQPRLTVPAKWAFNGVEQSLRPGEYGWYVWPIVGGQRQSHAVVQTTVSIP